MSWLTAKAALSRAATMRTPSPASRLLQFGMRADRRVRSARRPPRFGFGGAPSRGRVEVLRSGQPGMDAGLAAHGHGWPIAAGPRSRTGARACRALARHRTKGARAFGYFALFKVTRRKGGTLSRRYRSNGYVHDQTNPSTTKTSSRASSHRYRVQRRRLGFYLTGTQQSIY